MKKMYDSPEFDLFEFSFESIMDDKRIGVSFNEHGSSDNNDDDNKEW